MIFIVDFDGTLATEDTVDKLLEQHADPAWRELEADWLEGRIDALECMQNQVSLVRAGRTVLAGFFESIRLDPHFPDFYRYVSDFASLAIVSDGLDQTIHHTLKRDGLGDLPVFANRLRSFGTDQLDLSFPHRRSDCAAGNGVCKCAVAKRLATQHGGPVVLIGDGKSDACLAARADVVFAKSSLITHCQAAGIAHTPFNDFGDVLRTVQAWETGERLSANA